MHRNLFFNIAAANIAKKHDIKSIDRSENALLKSTSEGYFVIDSNWRVSYANLGARNFSTLTGKEEIGQKIAEIFPSSDFAAFMAHYALVAETGTAEHFEEVYEGRVLQVHAYRTQENGIAVFYRDITEQKEILRRKEWSEFRYRTLTDTLPQLVWTALPSGKCDYLSEQWSVFTGVPLPAVPSGEWFKSIMHPDDFNRVAEFWTGAVNDIHSYDTEYRIRSKEGEYHWFKARGNPIRNEKNEIIYWFGSCTDVEDEHRVQDELRKSVKVREDFLSLASHELKTPLTALMLQTQILKRAIKRGDPSVYRKDKVDRLADQTERQLNRLVRLVEDVLDFGRIQSGQFEIKPSVFDFFETVQNCIEVLAPQFASSSGALPVLIPGDACFVEWDLQRIEQVVSNLLVNALKYGQGKPVEVRIAKSGDWVTLTVKDQGLGIASDLQNKIFDRFERAISVSEVSGLGLGLYIVKQIVETHQGKIWVESVLGEGSTFTLQMPIKLVMH